MYRFLYITIFFLVIALPLKAQENLIINGSFEQIDSCYGNAPHLGFDVFQWSGCVGWNNPTYASSDLWCQNPVAGVLVPPSITGIGYQSPKTGENMAGIIVFQTNEEYREYIQNELIQPLEKNKYYEFTLYVSNAEYDPVYRGTTSCLQVFFSSTAPTQPSFYNHLSLTPQVVNNPSNFYTDTANWILFSGIYKAMGNENYVTIGCFENDNNIPLTVQMNNTTGSYIYFFIDDVSLTEVPCDITITNIFTPNNDGMNENWQPELCLDDNEQANIIIYNRWGNKVFESVNNDSYWDGKTTSGTDVPEGTYYYIITTKKETYKGTVQLLR